MKRFAKVLVTVAATAALSACAQGNGHRAGGEVLLIQRGSRATNAYALAYQTCSTTPIQRIATDVMAPSIDPSVVAGALARSTFAPAVRGAAERGCRDALQGMRPRPPR